MNHAKVPVTVMGGIGSDDDFIDLFEKHKIIGASAGSYFVFKGKYRAVLISYPNYKMKTRII